MIFDLHRKAGKPFTCRSSPYGQPFDLAFYGSMELDLDITNLGKIELTSIELEPLLRIGKRIVPTSSPKSWISRILSMCLRLADHSSRNRYNYTLIYLLK